MGGEGGIGRSISNRKWIQIQVGWDEWGGGENPSISGSATIGSSWRVGKFDTMGEMLDMMFSAGQKSMHTIWHQEERCRLALFAGLTALIDGVGGIQPEGSSARYQHMTYAAAERRKLGWLSCRGNANHMRG